MDKKDMTVEFIKRISGQQAVLTIPTLYLDLLEDDIKTALFFSQVVYWSDKGKRSDGWFYKTDKEWKEEIRLSEYECKKARDKLVSLGVLLVSKKKANGVPTMHYKVEWDNLSKWVLEKFNNRTGSVYHDTSVSENFGNPFPKNSGTHSLKTPESLTENTNKDYNKDYKRDNTFFPSNVLDGKAKQTSLFEVKNNSLEALKGLKGKDLMVKRLQLVAAGEIDANELSDLELCLYYSVKHKEIVGYDIPYQKQQHMETWRNKYDLSVAEAFHLLPKVAQTFREICETEKRKKSEWFLKIGWFTFDAPSDIARIMDKVKPKVNEKYLQDDKPQPTINPDTIVDEIF